MYEEIPYKRRNRNDYVKVNLKLVVRYIYQKREGCNLIDRIVN